MPDPTLNQFGNPIGDATAADSADVQNAARIARQQAQMDAALQLEQQKAMLEQTRAQHEQSQTNRVVAEQGAASDAAQWMQNPQYPGKSFQELPPEDQQHFLDAWSTVPGGGIGVADKLPQIWNQASRNATGNPNIGLENMQEGQTAVVDMNGTKVTVGKPPAIKVDQATGRPYKVDPETGEPSYVTINDPQQAKGPLGEAALTGDDYLQSLDPKDAENIKAIADGRLPLSTYSTRTGNQRARIAAMVQQYDPTADASTLTKRAAVMRDFGSGKSAAAIRAGNSAIAHLNELADIIPGLNNTNVQGWNAYVANPIARQTSPDFNKAEGAFNTTAGIVAAELSKFFGGTGGTTVSEVKRWHDSLNPATPPGTLKGNIESAIKLLADQMDNYRTQYEAGMGKTKNIPFIYPETQKVLDQLQSKGVNTSAARAVDADLTPASGAPQTTLAPAAAPVAPNAQPPQFDTPEAVRDAYKAGTLPRAQAEAILKSRFGHQ
jgi:hypothetical protein